MVDLPAGFRIVQPGGAGGVPAIPPGFRVVQPGIRRDAQGREVIADTDARAGLPIPDTVSQFEASGGNRGKPMTGLAENLGAGFDSGVNKVLGAPVDIPVWVGNTAIDLTNAGADALGQGRPIPNIPTDLPGSSQKFEQMQEQFGFTPPSKVAPANPAEAIARGAGEAAAMSLLPETMLIKGGQVLTQVPKVVQRSVETISALFGQSRTGGQLARSTVTNAAAGGGAEAAMEAAPEGWEPAAGLAGGLTAATAAHGLTALPTAIQGALKTLGDYLAPIAKSGQERLAGRVLRESAEHPGQVIDDLTYEQGDILPGSKPTTFQQTGDMGLGQLERGVATRDPAAFNQRAAEQNAARVAAVENIQPGGAPEQVVASVRGFLDDIEREASEIVDAARRDGEQRINALGAVGEAETGAALGRARAATEALGVGRTPDVAGSAMRESIETSLAPVKKAERALWDAVDPDGTLELAPQSTKTTVAQLKGEHSSLAKPFGSEEAAIYQDIGTAGDVVPLRDIAAFRSRVTQAIADERAKSGKSPAWARLVQLRGAIEDDLEHAVERIVIQQADAVARGEMSELDTIEAAIQRQREAWFGEAAARAQHGGGGSRSSGHTSGGPYPVSGVRGAAGQGGGGFGPASRDPRLPQDAGAAAEGLTIADTSGRRSAGQLGERLAVREHTPNAPGRSQGTLTPAPPKPVSEAGYAERAASTGKYTPARPGVQAQRPFDDAAKARLDQATAATRDRANTFDNRTIGPLIARPADHAPYDIPAGAVPGRIFSAGPRAPEAIQAFRKAVGDEQAMPVLRDYAVDRLLRAARTEDGLIDPARAASWRRQHSDALRAFPELDRAIDDAVKAAADAGESVAIQKAAQAAAKKAEDARLAEVTRAERQKVDEVQRGVVGRLLGVSDPQDVTRIIGSVFGRQDAVAEMQKLRRAIGGNEQGKQGLRKAVADYLIGRFVGNTEAATSGVGTMKSDQFQTFIGRNKGVLEVAGFTADDLRLLDDIAADLQRANRSIASVKRAGGSNTAQDLLAATSTGGRASMLLRAVVSQAKTGGAGVATGILFGPWVGIPVYAGALLTSALRQRGIESVNDLVRDAMLDPALARELMIKAMPGAARERALGLVQMLTRAEATSSVKALEGEERERRPNALSMPPAALSAGSNALAVSR